VEAPEDLLLRGLLVVLQDTHIARLLILLNFHLRIVVIVLVVVNDPIDGPWRRRLEVSIKDVTDK
jgi:hypothetical protein